MFKNSLNNLNLQNLHVHLQRELAALNTIRIADSVEDNKLKNWFLKTLELKNTDSEFLIQLNRDNDNVKAFESFKILLNIYRNIGINEVYTSFDSYILIHDLAKPILQGKHDKLISSIMCQFDSEYGLWDHFNVKNNSVKKFYNLALRHHHILGVMIIGELNYQIYEELFDDKDFKELSENYKKIIFDFLLIHAALDSSAVGDGYLSRVKLNRYLEVINIIKNINIKNSKNELHEISTRKDIIQQRITWLLSSYDPLIDSRGNNYYTQMLNKEDWNRLYASTRGLAKIRRIVYGAKFLYSLFHQTTDLNSEQDLSTHSKAQKAFVDIMISMAEKAELNNSDSVEVHFLNIPKKDEKSNKIISQLNSNPQIFDSLYNSKSSTVRSPAIIEVNFENL